MKTKNHNEEEYMRTEIVQDPKYVDKSVIIPIDSATTSLCTVVLKSEISNVQLEKEPP